MENLAMMHFDYFDITIAAIVVILGIKGFVNGFIREVFGLIGLVAGVYFASRLADTAAAFIDNNFLHLQQSALLKLLGFLAVLTMIWLGAVILGAIIAKLSNTSPNLLSRFLGFLAGGAKYFIVFALIVTALSNTQLVRDKLLHYVDQSVLYPYLIETGSRIIHLQNTAQQREQRENPAQNDHNRSDNNQTQTPSEESRDNKGLQ